MKQARATKVAEPHQAALEEAAFLAAYRPGDFARPSVTVDVVAFTMIDALLRVLLVRRAQPPFKGYWALPGGFVRVGDGQREQGESLEAAVSRELEEETGLRPSDVYLEQLGAFGAPYRDPRMRDQRGLLRPPPPDLVARVRGGGDANAAEWVEPSAKLRLAFDHATILAAARERLRERVRSTSIAASLLPPAFTIPEIEHVYSTLIGERQDPGNFRRRFLGMIDEGICGDGHRASASRCRNPPRSIVFADGGRDVARDRRRRRALLPRHRALELRACLRQVPACVLEAPRAREHLPSVLLCPRQERSRGWPREGVGPSREARAFRRRPARPRVAPAARRAGSPPAWRARPRVAIAGPAHRSRPPHLRRRHHADDGRRLDGAVVRRRRPPVRTLRLAAAPVDLVPADRTRLSGALPILLLGGFGVVRAAAVEPRCSDGDAWLRSAGARGAERAVITGGGEPTLLGEDSDACAHSRLRLPVPQGRPHHQRRLPRARGRRGRCGRHTSRRRALSPSRYRATTPTRR